MRFIFFLVLVLGVGGWGRGLGVGGWRVGGWGLGVGGVGMRVSVGEGANPRIQAPYIGQTLTLPLSPFLNHVPAPIVSNNATRPHHWHT